ncbi:MAG: hypothetical protein PHT95_04000 [Candidatus Omnitrophica bacterium]|nr:hypothetical protein [Candidatus Omnitrophota bacterium]
MARLEVMEGKDASIELAKAMTGYVSANEDFFRGFIAEGQEPVLLRIPVEVMEGLAGTEAEKWIASLNNNIERIFVELYTMQDPDGVTFGTGVYGRYGLTKKDFSSQRSLKNTLSIIGINPGMSVEERRDLQLTVQTSQSLRDSVMMPMAYKGDASGVIRSVIFGFRVIYIANYPENNDFIEETVSSYNDFIGSFSMSPDRLTVDDILALLDISSINSVLRVLRKIIDMLPVERMPAEELRVINEHAMKMATAA